MSTEGVDYSYDRPDPGALSTAGKRFVVRYGALGNAAKFLTWEELALLQEHGLAVVANVEESAGGFRGAAAGQRWAAAGDAFFRGLGMPADRPIYFSVDWDASPADWPDIDAALRGAASVIGAGRVGVYGSFAVVEHCRAAGTAAWLWQTYAWSGGRWSPGAHLQQYKNSQTLGGGAVDLDRAMVADYGQWGSSVATSQNGWLVATAAQQDDGLYAGVEFPNGALAGDVAWVFRWLVEQLDYWVEPIVDGSCWGWYVKPVAGQTTGYSNHSSGTAMDYNATKHGLGAEDTFTPAQVSTVHRLLAELDGVVRWGGDYSGRKDPMHFEIVKNAAAVHAVRLKLEDDVTAAEVWTQDVITNPKQRADSPLATPPGPNVATQAGYALGDIWARVYDLRDSLKSMNTSLGAAISALAAKDQVDEVALAAALIPGLIAGVVAALPEGSEIDQEQITTAFTAALREAFGAPAA